MDRDFIWPIYVSEVIPDYQNHITHTFPLITAFLDNFLFKKNYNESNLKAIFPTFIAGYVCTVYCLLL